MNNTETEKGAVLSDCRAYRYALWRRWDQGPACVFVGLNPSTADENEDDPTIRRCVRFARDWGYPALVMLNAYAFRATDPAVMKVQPDPFGIDNYPTLSDQCKQAGIVVAAWGTNIDPLHERRVLNTITEKCTVYCLGKTKAGHPKHPLYIRADTKPEVYREQINAR